MAIHPELKPILDGMLARAPEPEEVPVDRLRAVHAAETEALAGSGPEVASVRDTDAGGVPVRVYEPEGARGTVVYLHGGGWVLGTLDSVDAVCRALAVAAGARVASADYRLAPEHRFPAAVEDALTVVRCLAGGPLVVAGDSAGGNLAAVCALRLREQVKGQLLVYPVTDAALDTPSYRRFGEGYGLTTAAMARFWRLYLDGADGLQPDASPLHARDLEGAPPAHILTAECDVLRDDGEAYAAALERAGVPVTLRRLEGAIHGFWRWQTTGFARRAAREAGAVVRAALDA